VPVEATITIEGLRDLERALLDLAPKEARRALRSGLSAGGKVVERAAVANLRQKTAGTGLLEKALRVRARVQFGGLKAGFGIPGLFSIRLTERDDTKGRLLVKVGTYKPSKIAGASKKYPYDPYYARWVEFGTVKMPARPFLAPALEQNRASVITILKEKTMAAIRKLNSRVR